QRHGHERRRRQLCRRRERRLLRRLAARAELRVRAPGDARAPPLAHVDHAREPRRVLRPRRVRAAGRAAELGRGVVRGRAVAAGAMGTPVILQRSAAALGGMPAAVGRYFSPNGDRVTLGVFDEAKVRDLLGLERAPGVPYEAYAIGRPITTASYDYLDASLPEFSRFSLEQIYFPPIVDILAEDGVDGPPVWFGVDKRTLTTKFASWLTVLAMTEDANEGVFVTDGSAVPTSLCVNPSLTIAALAERASALLLQRGTELGLTLRARVPPPGRTDAVRRRRCVNPV